MADEQAYFYGAPGSFAPGDDTNPFHSFTQEQIEHAARLLLEASASASAGNNKGADTGKPSWAAVAATKPAKNARIVPDYPAPEVPKPVVDEDTRPNCVFFLNGACRFGDSCRFRHVRPSSGAVEYFLEQMAVDRSKDIVAGETPPEMSNLLASLRESSVALESTVEDAKDAQFAADSEAWQAESIRKKDELLQRAIDAGIVTTLAEAETALQVAERSLSADVACGVCLEHIVDAPGGRFGLLTGCSHAFCLDCIRQWRARTDLPKSTVRSCPVCRTISFFVVPCDRYITDPARKAAVNSEYHASQQTIPCRYYDYGRGTCPFGSSCRYAHLNPDGSVALQTRAVYRLDSEGGVASIKPYKLSEFL